MNVAELEAELALIVDDTNLATKFNDWINNAVLEIANDFALPALRLNEPVELSITESDWLYDMPASYLKQLYKCYDEDFNKVTIHRSIDDIDSLDIDHDETGDNVTHVAVRDLIIGVFPMATDTLSLWYYEQPTTDDLTCIPAQYHYRVIVPKIVIINFELLQDMSVNAPHKSLDYWHRKYNAGLYGDGSDLGMINCLAREKKPKRHGGAEPLP